MQIMPTSEQIKADNGYIDFSKFQFFKYAKYMHVNSMYVEKMNNYAKK